MRHYNLYVRMAGYASAPDLRRLGGEAAPMLEEHQVAAQALRVDVRPIAQGPSGQFPSRPFHRAKRPRSGSRRPTRTRLREPSPE